VRRIHLGKLGHSNKSDCRDLDEALEGNMSYPIVVRWSGQNDKGIVINEFHWAGFVDGHSAVFSNEEFIVIHETNPGTTWDFTWRMLLPGNQ